MIFVWALLLAAAVSNVSGNRIAGGQTTTIQANPETVQIDFLVGIFWNQNCAAVILTRQAMVSVADCFDGLLVSRFTRRARVGSSERHTGGTTVNFLNWIIHPEYQSHNSFNNIVILRLETLLTFSDSVGAGSFPPQGFEMPVGISVSMVGWGSERENVPVGSSTIRQGIVLTIDFNVCESRYDSLWPSRPISQEMMCVGNLDEGGVGSCSGDFGGPVKYDGITIGLMSWSYGCGHPTYPEVLVKISAYIDWFQQTLGI